LSPGYALVFELKDLKGQLHPKFSQNQKEDARLNKINYLVNINKKNLKKIKIKNNELEKSVNELDKDAFFLENMFKSIENHRKS
jgi:mevalonate kinase